MVYLNYSEYGAYYISAYFFAKLATSTLCRTILIIPSYLLSYMLAIKDPIFEIFICHLALVILVSFAGDSVGTLTSSLQLPVETTLSMSTVITLTMMLLGGFYIPKLPPFLFWLAYLSPFSYLYDAAIQISFQVIRPNRVIICQGGIFVKKCMTATSVKSVDVVTRLTGSALPFYLNITIILGMTIVYYIISYTLIRHVPPRKARN